MKLLDKLKNALFEEDEEEEVKKPRTSEESLVKKIDVVKTTSEEERKTEFPSYGMQDFSMEEAEPVRQKAKGPIIFDDEDFLSDTKELTFKEIPKKEEKILYGGYETNNLDKKEKFHPSPIISPVYGVLDKNYTTNDKETNEPKSLDRLFADESKKEISFDMVREKAFGEPAKKEEPEEETDPYIYEMQEEDETPGIEKVTLGDAEEYFEDLGLEYEVDYKDASKAKQKNMTRSKKNKELATSIEEEMKDELSQEEPVEMKSLIETEKESLTEDNDYVEPEEKNLYDLIDMMYEDKN